MRRTSLSAVVAACLLFTACSDDAETEAGIDATIGETATTAADGASDTTEAEEPSAEEVDLDARYVFGDSRIVSSFDPHKASNNYDVRWLAPAYDRLIHALPDGGIEPGLATDWEFTDPTTLVMNLREGVVFHDGHEFTAETVKANLERAMTLEAASAVTKTAVEPIESVEVLDTHTVQINLNRPSSGLIFDLAIQPGFMISPDAFDNPDLETNPVGSGMFVLKEFVAGDRAIYSRFDDYWDPDAALVEELELVNMANADTRLNAVQSGQMDSTFLEYRQIPTAEAAGLDVEVLPTLSFFNLYVNTSDWGMDNEKVRQALSYAVDREMLAQIIGGDPTVQPFPEADPGYNPDWPADTYAYDPERARELLAEAGYPDGITLGIQVYTRPEDQQMFELLQASTAQAGITLEPTIVEPGGAEIFINEGTLPLFLGRFGGRLDPLQTLNTIVGPNGGLNPPLGGSSTPEMEELLAQIDATELGEERNELVRQASGLLAETALEIPLFIRSVPYVSDECVVGFEPFVSGSEEYGGVGIRQGCG